MQVRILLLFLGLTLARLGCCDDPIIIWASDGDTVKCYNIKNQPAFDNELLKNHKIQEYPSEIPRNMEINKKSHWQTHEAQISTAKCPDGTIPVRQDGPTSSSNTNPPHEYAIRTTSTPSELYGTKTKINVWKPKIEKGADEMSISQIWLTTGDYDSNDLNTIEVGWQVYPNLYMDNKPRLFTFWTSDTYNTTGCYNLQCPGFIQISSSIVIGGSISPVSTFESNQFEITVFVWKDRKHGNWWLSLGPNNTLVGYWPAELFRNLAHADMLQWGGEITNRRTFDRHTTTQMGSGRFPDEGFGKASYFRNVEIVDKNNNLQSIQDLNIHVDNSKFYNIKNLFTDELGTHFFYGGPGFSRMRSGAVHSILPSSLFYLCFSLLFII